MIRPRVVLSLLSGALLSLNISPIDEPVRPAIIKVAHLQARPAPVFKWTPTHARTYIKDVAESRGWHGSEWICLSTLIEYESHFNYKAANDTSSAFGIFQILDTPHDLTVPAQTDRGFRYIAHRYGSPCSALSFWYGQAKKGRPYY